MHGHQLLARLRQSSPRLLKWLVNFYLIRFFRSKWTKTISLDCPCNEHCPNGCAGCPNPICVCGDNPTLQNEDNLKTCVRDNSIELGQCILDCNGDQSCELTCVGLFKKQHDTCPCQVNNILMRPKLTLI